MFFVLLHVDAEKNGAMPTMHSIKPAMQAIRLHDGTSALIGFPPLPRLADRDFILEGQPCAGEGDLCQTVSTCCVGSQRAIP
mmetsp:Transcript_108490/g.183832  ORF Transcript_108490/g.183832 Transcript_108490/m.183832 type:complete len:82 (-) Transcript_108490:339-584(-)